MNFSPLVSQLRAALGAENVLSAPSELAVYDCDALTIHRQMPAAVVFPRSTRHVVDVVRICARHGAPIVPRGAGTSLAGGCLPVRGSVLVMPRSFQPRSGHHRRQRGHQRRRPAYAQVWGDGQSCLGAGNRAQRRRGAPSRPGARPGRARPGQPPGRQRRHVGHRHPHLGAADTQSARVSHHACAVRFGGRCHAGRQRHHCRGDHSGGHGVDGPGHPGGGGRGVSFWIPAGCGRGVDHRGGWSGGGPRPAATAGGAVLPGTRGRGGASGVQRRRAAGIVEMSQIVDRLAR